MILYNYLKLNGINVRQFHVLTGIPESTIRSVNTKPIKRWNIEFMEALSEAVKKEPVTVLEELKKLESNINLNNTFGYFDLENRRYIGSKSKLSFWIRNLINEHTEGDSFFDVFAGTGVITKSVLDDYNRIIINDFLYSNNVIYNAFFGTDPIDTDKIKLYESEFNSIDYLNTEENYVSVNFGEKFFSYNDAKIIGEIRERIQTSNDLTNREVDFLLASLIYSIDKIANTVGHYDAYRKNQKLKDKFVFKLIKPLDTKDKKVEIYREDANELVKKIKSDVAFIDPPYNSRQYSRFYHLLETIIKWDKPDLSGVAMKPPEENMSDYCRKSAPEVFKDLITNINSKYIVVTYNNTYNSKSSSSMNKITLEEILFSLNTLGETKVFEKPHQFFNAGKTDLKDHKEYLFITKTNNYNKKGYSEEKSNKKGLRSPLFYVGDKYKLMPQLLELFPENINNYYDVFTGGGSASINVEAKSYSLNDINYYVIQLHKHLIANSPNINIFIDRMYEIINRYNLSLSEQSLNEEIIKLKKEYKKTYFSKYNKDSYLKLRNDYNNNPSNCDLLYLLLIYGFNHMIRFNDNGEFNLPVGNVDWNKNVTQALNNYANWVNKSNIKQITNLDFEEFIKIQKFKNNDFVYFDPPYLITSSDYNKIWDEEDEIRLYNLLDDLNDEGVTWGLSNMLNHKDKHNNVLEEWSTKYKTYSISSNYISRFDNTIKKDSKEIYVTNYKKW